MNLIELTHANTKREILVASQLVFVVQYSEANKCTHIISNAGAIIPVIETVNEVREKLGLLNRTEGK